MNSIDSKTPDEIGTYNVGGTISKLKFLPIGFFIDYADDERPRYRKPDAFTIRGIAELIKKTESDMNKWITNANFEYKVNGLNENHINRLKKYGLKIL